jgi:hypothetical protein
VHFLPDEVEYLVLVFNIDLRCAKQVEGVADEKHAIKSVLCVDDAEQIILENAEYLFEKTEELLTQKPVKRRQLLRFVVLSLVVIDETCKELVHKLHVFNLLCFQLLLLFLQLCDFVVVLVFQLVLRSVCEVVENNVYKGVAALVFLFFLGVIWVSLEFFLDLLRSLSLESQYLLF